METEDIHSTLWKNKLNLNVNCRDSQRHIPDCIFSFILELYLPQVFRHNAATNQGLHYLPLIQQCLDISTGITLDRALAPMTLFIFHCRSEISAVRRIDAPKISMPRKKIIGAPGKGWIRFLVRFGSTRKRLSR